MSNVSNESDNVLEPAVSKALARIREMLQDAKKALSDFTEGKEAALNGRADDLENATCEQSEVVEQRLADIEVAICELSEQIDGTAATE